jgi:hypothetical protein
MREAVKGHGFIGCGKTHLFLTGDEFQASMRGDQDQQDEVFSYIPLEKRVPQEHPLRRLREMAALSSMLAASYRRLAPEQHP